MPEKGLLSRIYFARDQVPDCPDFTRAKNKLLSWDKYFMPRHNTQNSRTESLPSDAVESHILDTSFLESATLVQGIQSAFLKSHQPEEHMPEDKCILVIKEIYCCSQ